MLATLAIINMAVASVLITEEVNSSNAQEPTEVVATVESKETETSTIIAE